MSEQKQKKNRLVEAFTRDYKYEGLLLLILSIISIVIGVYFLGNPPAINDLLGIPVKVVFWLLIVLGGVSLLLSIWPYYKPSIYEVRRITWPTKKEMLENSISTFIFVLIFVAFFLVVDLGLGELLDWIKSWGFEL
jgi:preprotein translocase subunit SecE